MAIKFREVLHAHLSFVEPVSASWLAYLSVRLHGRADRRRVLGVTRTSGVASPHDRL
jgi:hypothetical protein